MENPTKDGKEFRYIVRIANTDLDGHKAVFLALRKIKGINFSFSNAICNIAGVEKNKKTGYLDEHETSKIDEVIKSPVRFGIPSWLFNRRRDPETGEDYHYLSGNLVFAKEQDIKNLKKIKCYRGIRHMFGLPVRGQKTKSNFRKTKRKGGSIGVKRKK